MNETSGLSLMDIVEDESKYTRYGTEGDLDIRKELRTA